MFIRFVCGKIDEDSHVSAGLFCAAFDLIKDEKLSDHDYAEMADLMRMNRLDDFLSAFRSDGECWCGVHGRKAGSTPALIGNDVRTLTDFVAIY